MKELILNPKEVEIGSMNKIIYLSLVESIILLHQKEPNTTWFQMTFNSLPTRLKQLLQCLPHSNYLTEPTRRDYKHGKIIQLTDEFWYDFDLSIIIIII